MNDYFEKIKSLIAHKGGTDPEEVTPESYFDADLNIGEMELEEIITDLEDIYHIDLSEDKDSIETVQNLCDALAEKLD